MHFAVDYCVQLLLHAIHPRSFGACSRGIPEDGARRGVPRRRLITVAPGGTGPRPPGTTTRTRGARCDRSGSNSGEGSAGPEPKIATVERREAGVPRHGTQGASLGAWPAALRAGPTGASQAPDDSRRSATPSIGVAKPKFQNPGAQNAPRERGRLFDERLPQVDGGGAKKQRREPSGRLQRQNSPSGEGCASENGIASCWTGPMPASGL